MNEVEIRCVRSIALLLCVMPWLVACERNDSGTPIAATVNSPIEKLSLIRGAIDSPDRFAGDSDEDEWRRPRLVLEFMGVEPGMQVLDYFAAAGYFSELLARSVGPAGSVIVYNNPPYARFAGEKLVNRFANNRLENAKLITTPTADLKLEPASLDGVLFFLAYHDLYWKPQDSPLPFGNPGQVTAALFAAVKPGGVVVVVDHVANAGGDTAKVVDALHRIDPQAVKNDLIKAGFTFDAEDSSLRNAEDDRTKEVSDPSMRRKTDRFVYRFRKPVR